jgi:hypothetical protein
MPLVLEWMKCLGDRWCCLFDVRLDSRHLDELNGVYIIWYWEDRYLPAVVRVGQGNIKERLLQDRQKPAILALKDYDLVVTWAFVGESQRDGVERYLGETLDPIIKSLLPEASPIRVILPWEGSYVLSKKI